MPGGSGSQPLQSQTGTNVASTTPAMNAAPYLSGLMGEATNQYQQAVNMGDMPQNRVADWTQPYSEGISALSNLSNDPRLTQGIQGAMDLSKQQMENYGLTPDLQATQGRLSEFINRQQGEQNPYLQQILDTQNRLIGDRVNASMSGSGRYGSGAHTDVMTRALAEAEAPILAQDYAARQQLQLSGLGQLGQGYQAGANRAGQFAQLAPTLQQAYTLPAQLKMQVGQAYQQQAQAQRDAELAHWENVRNYPLQALSDSAGIIIPAAGGMGKTTTSNLSTTLSQPQAPLGRRVLGGALAGAGIGSAFGPWGAPIGAAGGGLLGLMG